MDVFSSTSFGVVGSFSSFSDWSADHSSDLLSVAPPLGKKCSNALSSLSWTLYMAYLLVAECAGLHPIALLLAGVNGILLSRRGEGSSALSHRELGGFGGRLSGASGGPFHPPRLLRLPSLNCFVRIRKTFRVQNKSSVGVFRAAPVVGSVYNFWVRRISSSGFGGVS